MPLLRHERTSTNAIAPSPMASQGLMRIGGHAQWVADTLAKYKLRYVVGHGMLFPMLRFGDTVTKQLDAGGTSAWTADNDFDLYLIDPPRDIYSKLEEECKRAGYTSSGRRGAVLVFVTQPCVSQPQRTQRG